jgi:hypothetical protein
MKTKSTEYKKWNVGLPGGPSGPFYSVVSQDGMIIAMQIPEKEVAELIASIPELLAKIEDLKAVQAIALAPVLGQVILFDGEKVVGMAPNKKRQ